MTRRFPLFCFTYWSQIGVIFPYDHEALKGEMFF